MRKRKKNIPILEGYTSVLEISKKYGISVDTLRKRIRMGMVVGEKYMGKWFIANNLVDSIYPVHKPKNKLKDKQLTIHDLKGRRFFTATITGELLFSRNIDNINIRLYRNLDIKKEEIILITQRGRNILAIYFASLEILYEKYGVSTLEELQKKLILENMK